MGVDSIGSSAVEIGATETAYTQHSYPGKSGSGKSGSQFRGEYQVQGVELGFDIYERSINEKSKNDASQKPDEGGGNTSADDSVGRTTAHDSETVGPSSSSAEENSTSVSSVHDASSSSSTSSKTKTGKVKSNKNARSLDPRLVTRNSKRLHGLGAYDFGNGDTYEGFYYQSKKHGVGSYNYHETGDRYIGFYNRGQKHGIGMYCYGNRLTAKTDSMKTDSVATDSSAIQRQTPAESRSDSTWNNVYIGSWSSGVKSGFGIFYFEKTNGLYIGDFAHDKMNGKGRLALFRDFRGEEAHAKGKSNTEHSFSFLRENIITPIIREFENLIWAPIKRREQQLLDGDIEYGTADLSTDTASASNTTDFGISDAFVNAKERNAIQDFFNNIEENWIMKAIGGEFVTSEGGSSTEGGGFPKLNPYIEQLYFGEFQSNLEHGVGTVYRNSRSLVSVEDEGGKDNADSDTKPVPSSLSLPVYRDITVTNPASLSLSTLLLHKTASQATLTKTIDLVVNPASKEDAFQNPFKPFMVNRPNGDTYYHGQFNNGNEHGLITWVCKDVIRIGKPKPTKRGKKSRSKSEKRRSYRVGDPQHRRFSYDTPDSKAVCVASSDDEDDAEKMTKHDGDNNTVSRTPESRTPEDNHKEATTSPLNVTITSSNRSALLEEIDIISDCHELSCIYKNGKIDETKPVMLWDTERANAWELFKEPESPEDWFHLVKRRDLKMMLGERSHDVDSQEIVYPGNSAADSATGPNSAMDSTNPESRSSSATDSVTFSSSSSSSSSAVDSCVTDESLSKSNSSNSAKDLTEVEAARLRRRLQKKRIGDHDSVRIAIVDPNKDKSTDPQDKKKNSVWYFHADHPMPAEKAMDIMRKACQSSDLQDLMNQLKKPFPKNQDAMLSYRMLQKTSSSGLTKSSSSGSANDSSANDSSANDSRDENKLKETLSIDHDCVSVVIDPDVPLDMRSRRNSLVSDVELNCYSRRNSEVLEPINAFQKALLESRYSSAMDRTLMGFRG